MNLVVDIGNSRLKWAFGVVDAPWQVCGELAVDRNFEQTLDGAWRDLPPPRRVVVCSVAGRRVEAAVRRTVEARWRLEPHTARARAEQLGLVNHYDRPGQLGADRWAAMIGARRRCRDALCVVDAGTAVTVDGVNADGDFVGGVILPGLAMGRRALVRGAARIGDVEEAPADVRGRNTAQAVGAGTMLGLVGGVDRVLEQFGHHLGGGFHLFLTGGDAPRLMPLLRHRPEHVPDLVLRGLAAIAGQLP